MRVLVMESDRHLGAFLRKVLENEGHSAEWLEDADQAIQYAAQHHPDLIVLDLGLHTRDGADLLTELKAIGSDAALLALTGRNDLHARIQCLDMGADDCLLKPFSFLEFTARCRALLRRRSRVVDQVLRCADLELHRINHQVRCAGEQIALTTKEFALLEYLMLRRGESVSRAELLADVWKLEPNTATNIVDVYINYLRRKLERHGAAGRLIHTVRGTGYRIGGPPPASGGKSRVALRPPFTPVGAVTPPLAVAPC